MSHDPSKAARLAKLLFVVRHLERIAGYVRDVCELTIYMNESVFYQPVGQKYVATDIDNRR